MRLRVQDKIEAIRLRKLGYTYSEIRKVIPVSKSLLSGWFRGVQMTEEEVQLIERTLTYVLSGLSFETVGVCAGHMGTTDYYFVLRLGPKVLAKVKFADDGFNDHPDITHIEDRIIRSKQLIPAE